MSAPRIGIFIIAYNAVNHLNKTISRIPPEVYEQVANAYISALEARAKKGEPVKNISSVASFFVSRVDAIVEKSFDELLKAGKVKALAQTHIRQLEAKARELLAMKSALEHLVQGCRGDDRPDCPIIEVLAS